MDTSITEIGQVVADLFLERLSKSLKEEEPVSSVFLEVESYLQELGVAVCKELLEAADQAVRELPERKKNWHVQEKSAPNSLTTLFGEVSYQRTYYKHKHTGQYAYLSDEQLGISSHDKMDLALKARLVEEATETPYRRSGKKASRAVEISGQAVMEAIRQLGPLENKEVPYPREKRKARVLYIEADEDHVALQKGPVAMPYLVYVHEGKEAVGKKRYKLIRPRYFGGIYDKAETLWTEVVDYLEEVYDYEAIERIYLTGDGALWIRAGVQEIAKSVYVVDRYHLQKYMKQATAHLPGSLEELQAAVDDYDKAYLEETFALVLKHTESDAKRQAVTDARTYLRNVWKSIAHHQEADYLNGSAEGHVSHVFSARMSSRPQGWSLQGVDQMARLRVFRANGGELYPVFVKRRQMADRQQIRLEMEEAIHRQRKQSSKGPETLHNLQVLNLGKRSRLALCLKDIRGF